MLSVHGFDNDFGCHWRLWYQEEQALWAFMNKPQGIYKGMKCNIEQLGRIILKLKDLITNHLSRGGNWTRRLVDSLGVAVVARHRLGSRAIWVGTSLKSGCRSSLARHRWPMPDTGTTRALSTLAYWPSSMSKIVVGVFCNFLQNDPSNC